MTVEMTKAVTKMSVIYDHKIVSKLEKGFFHPIWSKGSQREIHPLGTTVTGPDKLVRCRSHNPTTK